MIVRARVRKGRLIVDEPTYLPDGSEVALEMVDDLQASQRLGQGSEDLRMSSYTDIELLVQIRDVLARIRADACRRRLDDKFDQHFATLVEAARRLERRGAPVA